MNVQPTKIMKGKIMGITLKEIAAEVGVSFQAVSSVLNNKKRTHVSAEKRAMIMETAKRLGYVPNINARVLTGNPSHVIGVLVDSTAPSVSFRLLPEIERLASLRSYRTQVGIAHDDVDNFYENYCLLKQHGVDGIICIGLDYPGKNQLVVHYFSNSKKTVYIRPTPELHGVPRIELNIAGAIRGIIQALQSSGRKRIALFGAGEEYSIRQRIDGFLQEFPEGRNLIFQTSKNIIQNPEGIRQELIRLTKKKILPLQVDSVICSNDSYALMLCGILEENGLKVPDEIAVIGFDNDPFGACPRLPLSTVDHNTSQIAAAAVNMLFDEMAGHSRSGTVQIEPRLIFRKTTPTELER